MEIVTLPAIGLSRVAKIAFCAVSSNRIAPPQNISATIRRKPRSPWADSPARRRFSRRKILGAQTFLHESNTIPGRANRWLSRVVHQAFVGFPQAASRLHTRNVTTTGTPVRQEFQPRDAAACRAALGLDPARPVLLVMGGSQGATGINNLLIHSLAVLERGCPQPQRFAGPGCGQGRQTFAECCGWDSRAPFE